MMDAMEKFLAGFYQEEEYPALLLQRREYQYRRPFAGLRILDATPVFRNTLVKHLNLLGGGADLTVGFGGGIPFDAEIVAKLKEWGIPVCENGKSTETFDAVLDCAGANAKMDCRLGFSELTRSGMYAYADSTLPVFLADDSRIKMIETALGTGQGFLRAMRQLGHGDFQDRNVVIFGCGKVGRGVAMYAERAGAKLTVVDAPEVLAVLPEHWRKIDRHDRQQLDEALKNAWCVLSITGIRHALSQAFDFQGLIASDALIVNMGIEDEFGPAMPRERVLNGNEPLNFILEEPTLLRYIDPAMALHNAGLEELLGNSLPPGISRPSAELNRKYLDAIRAYGCIAPEITELEAWL